ncbi:putative membrane protein [Arthrobacter sp. MP_M7]|nr:putative membrane protein [Arthrobacter sp. MP_M4]MEC5202858.1 putative membrane protein [Arthrobacter sp. MP_M7]
MWTTLCQNRGMNTGSLVRGGNRRTRRSRLRLAAMLFAGLLAAAATGATGNWVEAPAVGWGAASLTYVVWVWVVIGRFNPAETRSHATAEDPSRRITDLLILAANVASLGAVAAVVVDSHAGGASPFAGGLLALASVALSWLLVQTLFTLRYAALYYNTGGKAGSAVGGIDFNQERPPQYTDFAYLATSLGMTYQVSDTALQNHGIRAEALKHSLLSYLFGTVILATTISLVINLAF